MARLGILIAALGIGCAPNTPQASGALEVTRTEACAQLTSLGDREIWLSDPQLVSSALVSGAAVVGDLVYSGDSGLPCDGTQCCLLVPYFYRVECDGFSIVLAPADRIDGSDEVDAALVTQTVECGGNTDGSTSGGAECRPDCNATYPSPVGRDVLAVRGRVPSAPSSYATTHLGRTTYVMAVHEVRLPSVAIDAGMADDTFSPPFDANCSESTPTIGCPCEAFVFADCLVCNGGRWQGVEDCHGIG